MMTLIEIMARSVGARPQQNKNCDVEYLMDAGALERFAELVRADEREACEVAAEQAAREAIVFAMDAEREACAGECDEWIKNGSALAEDIAAAIRARGNT